MTRHATESYKHNRCDFENLERDWWVLDATDNAVLLAMPCQGLFYLLYQLRS